MNSGSLAFSCLYERGIVLFSKNKELLVVFLSTLYGISFEDALILQLYRTLIADCIVCC